MTHRSDAFVTSGLCLAVGGFVLVSTAFFPETGQQGFGQGPGFYPDVLAASLLILGGLSLWFGLRAPRPSPGGAAVTSPEKPRPRYLMVAAVLGLSVAATLAMTWAGFLVVGFCLVLGSALLIKPPATPGQWAARVIFTVGILAVAVLVFEYFIEIQLPPAAWLG